MRRIGASLGRKSRSDVGGSNKEPAPVVFAANHERFFFNASGILECRFIFGMLQVE